MIENYAIEMKDANGKPSGHMFLNKQNAKDAATEVCKTHMPKNADSILAEKFDDTWNHFDVNKDGIVEVERMPQFLRYLTGNALNIDL